ncbi:hypothetical protein [Hymenobacter perfusus]|uniref:Uncharacterized protein n=1 Tax=Hymenobacter perfusus TaxID=1236770 RepID=A0A428KI11_9BACT|nr:hypothetical protein [Hymenobacter perfusus]RSK46106.1 hypothetical protein EI293_02750 [Hymenobacter perfusus]
MKTKLLSLAFAAVALLANTTVATALPLATASVAMSSVDYQEGFEAGQSVRASLLFDYGGNPHNYAFLTAIDEEIDGAYIYQQNPQSQADYDYWTGYIAGLSKR